MRCSRMHPDAEVVLFEKEHELGRHQTSHNNGVVHAGVYYEPGSLKAQLCRRGAGLLREFCMSNDIPYEECGKVVVATEPAELARLSRLHERAGANGVPGLRMLDEHGLREVEPSARGIAALHSPTTAVVDFARVARRLAADNETRGATIRLGAVVTRVDTHGSLPEIRLAEGSVLAVDRVLVCAGLQSDRL